MRKLQYNGGYRLAEARPSLLLRQQFFNVLPVGCGTMQSKSGGINRTMSGATK
jgi:hypothetical protein